MQYRASDIKALVVGSIVVFCGALLVVTMELVGGGSRAYDAAMHGAQPLESLARAEAFVSSSVFLVPVVAVAVLIVAIAAYTCGRVGHEHVRSNSLAIGAVAVLSLLAASLMGPLSLPVWVWIGFMILPLPSALIGGEISALSFALPIRPPSAIFGEEPAKERTFENIERDRESAQQYAVEAAHRRQEGAGDLRAIVDERRGKEYKREAAISRMMAIAKAAFMSHPAATNADFERCWPEIRDELMRRHTVNLLSETDASLEEITPEIQRSAAQSRLRLASGQSGGGYSTRRSVGRESAPQAPSAPFFSAMAVIGASRDGNIPRLKTLVESGADLNVKNAEGWTALMVSALRGQLEIARFLLERGATVDEKNQLGWTALRFASSVGDAVMIKMLIEFGADFDSLDEKGWSILMQAADEGNAASVGTLLEFGANRETRSRSHESALSIALRRGHSDIVQMLRKADQTGNKNLIH